jgi:hypothetical protein
MDYTFEDLVENFGVPKIIMPNTPRLKSFSGGYLGEDGNPDLQVEGVIYNRRYKHGETEFIIIKSRIEAYKRDEKKLLESLEKQNLKPVEFFYRYKGTRTWDYSTDYWEDDKVAIATEADVEHLSREGLLEAIEEKRVLWIVGWSSMGDKYVDFHIGSADFLPQDEGYHLLFDAPLKSEMTVGIGWNYEWEEQFFNYNSTYFIREVFSDK